MQLLTKSIYEKNLWQLPSGWSDVKQIYRITFFSFLDFCFALRYVVVFLVMKNIGCK